MIDQELVQSLKAWPFKEALQIIKKNGGLQNFKTPSKGYILLETGYGPSGYLILELLVKLSEHQW